MGYFMKTMRRGIFVLLWFLTTTAFGRVQAEEASLTWEPSTPSDKVAGYEIRYGLTPGDASFVHDAGPVLATTITGLESGRTYFFRARAYNMGKTIFSPDSNEVSKDFVLVLTAPINLKVE